jgi:shikimate kinase
MRLHKTVVMIGMMGAGKTAVGGEVARRLGVPFLDSDHEIERAADRSIAEIFARDGEGFFRDKEAQVIARLLSETPCILSVGGGAYLRAETRAHITGQGIAVWIKADLDLLWSRVRHKTTRPLLRTENPYQTLSDLLAARAPVYALADLVVETRAEYSIEATAGQILKALQTRPDVLS